MAFERLVALHIKDENMYSAYRSGMAPVLKKHGGYFTTDFKINSVVQENLGESVHLDPDINRVFSIRFPDKPAMEKFFADPEYKKIRDRYFTASVVNSYVLALFETGR